MGSRTEFDLTTGVNNWKSILFKSQNMTIDNINELESHLYDEMEVLKKIGLNTEEAFIISKNRIGNINHLTQEYSKVNSNVFFKNRITPYLKGILIFLSFITITELITNTFLLLFINLGIDEIYLNHITIGTLIISYAIFYALLYLKYKNQKFNLSKLTKIPVLLSILIASKLLTSLSLIFLTHTIDVLNFGNLQINLNAFKMSFVAFILVLSYLVHLFSKKENQTKIVT